MTEDNDRIPKVGFIESIIFPERFRKKREAQWRLVKKGWKETGSAFMTLWKLIKS